MMQRLQTETLSPEEEAYLLEQEQLETEPELEYDPSLEPDALTQLAEQVVATSKQTVIWMAMMLCVSALLPKVEIAGLFILAYVFFFIVYALQTRPERARKTAKNLLYNFDYSIAKSMTVLGVAVMMIASVIIIWPQPVQIIDLQLVWHLLLAGINFIAGTIMLHQEHRIVKALRGKKKQS